MKIKGSNIIIETLREQGVDTVFGYPGGQVIPLYDALYDYDDITHVLTCHEQGATHAAEGYARSTGKVGVAFATSGPGATNTVTGIADAFLDSIPIVVITGQVPRSLIGKDTFQEVDITGITIPITKHNFFVHRIEDLADIIRDAFRIAKSGRPGPVLIDVPKDIMTELYEYEAVPVVEKDVIHNLFGDDDIAEVVEMINSAERPLIYAGGGIISAGVSEKFVELVEKTGIPVVSTLMNLGAIPGNHELALGLVGMHGSRPANQAVRNSDLLISVGARFSDRVTGDTNRFAKDSCIVHIDIDQSEINKNVFVDKNLVGDIDYVLTKLIEQVDEKNHPEWMEMIKGFRFESKNDKSAFVPENIFNVIESVLGDDVIVATDVGQHQMWTAQYWNYTKPRHNITSGGLGTMGFGLGAAIGSKMGNPDKRVIHVTGDGSFRMNLNEMATVSGQNLPIITFLFKNNVLGMVRQWQKLFFDKRYSSTTLKDVINYEKLAEAFGYRGCTVRDLEALRTAVSEAAEYDGPSLIVCDISINEDVLPMVPPGAAMHDQVCEIENDEK